MKNRMINLIVVLLGCVSFSQVAKAGASPGTSNVNVVNTPNVNVANTPMVTLSGTPTVSLAPGASVSIANTPSVSLANTPNVNIANTPTVSVVTSTPVPLLARDVDNPARQPFQAVGSGSLLPGQTNVYFSVTTVPAGKQLVIEYVSAIGYMPVGQKLLSVEIISTVENLGLGHYLTVSPQGTDVFGSFDYFTATQDLRLYSDPGSTVTGFAIRNSTTSTGSINMAISGYLINVP